MFRPDFLPLGVPDSHGHLWYRFDPLCGVQSRRGRRKSNGHRSFDDDEAMWERVMRCHGGNGEYGGVYESGRE